jgi:hypothetical protein
MVIVLASLGLVAPVHGSMSTRSSKSKFAIPWLSASVVAHRLKVLVPVPNVETVKDPPGWPGALRDCQNSVIGSFPISGTRRSPDLRAAVTILAGGGALLAKIDALDFCAALPEVEEAPNAREAPGAPDAAGAAEFAPSAGRHIGMLKNKAALNENRKTKLRATTPGTSGVHGARIFRRILAPWKASILIAWLHA